MKKLTITVFILTTFLLAQPAHSQQQNRLVFAQVEYDGDWDPYPMVYYDVLAFLAYTTSIEVFPERQTVRLDSSKLFSYPFLIMLNNGKFDGFNKKEKENLGKFLNGGGIIFIEDSSGNKASRFNKQIRKEFEDIFPGKRFKKLEQTNAIFRAFYLLRGIGGRTITNNFIEGMDLFGRTAVIYSQNDMFGAWVRDKFGNYVWECTPGGDTQRFEAEKFTINLLLFSVTGTYKSDVVHKPFIEEKLRR